MAVINLLVYVTQVAILYVVCTEFVEFSGCAYYLQLVVVSPLC